MKKLFALLALLPALVFAQSFPSPTYKTVTTPATNQFYQNAGAAVSRIQDRMLVGVAALNNATNVAVQPDWLTTYQIAKGRTYGFIQTSQFAVLNGLASQDSLTTVVVGAQTAGRTASQSQVIAVTGLGVNNVNNAIAGNAAWGGYFEAFRDTTVSGNGGAYGVEIDSMNFTNATPVTDPYAQANDQTIGLQLASGGGFPAGSLFPSTVGINIQNNNTTFDKGIVFGSNSITGDNGTTGSGIAIALGFGHMLQWYGAAATPTSSIVTSGTTSAGGIQQIFTNNQVAWNNASAGPLFQMVGVGSSANYLQAQNATTGNAATLAAQGTDTNINISIAGKGTGAVNLKGAASTTPAPAGFLGETSSANTPGTSMTTGVTTNCASQSLTAGQWLVWGSIQYNATGTTTIQTLYAGINTVSATLPAYPQLSALLASFTTGGINVLSTPPVPLSLASTTTVFLVGNSSFGASTMTCSGTITAIRYH